MPKPYLTKLRFKMQIAKGKVMGGGGGPGDFRFLACFDLEDAPAAGMAAAAHRIRP
jgi:hypothetical protein